MSSYKVGDVVVFIDGTGRYPADSYIVGVVREAAEADAEDGEVPVLEVEACARGTLPPKTGILRKDLDCSMTLAKLEEEGNEEGEGGLSASDKAEMARKRAELERDIVSSQKSLDRIEAALRAAKTAAERAKLQAERDEYEDYINMAEEELDAMDELVADGAGGAFAFARAPARTVTVPVSEVLCALPPKSIRPPLEELATLPPGTQARLSTEGANAIAAGRRSTRGASTPGVYFQLPDVIEAESEGSHRASGSPMPVNPSAGPGAKPKTVTVTAPIKAPSSSAGATPQATPQSPARDDKAAYEATIADLRARLARALEANPKEAELQLLREELAAKQEEIRKLRATASSAPRRDSASRWREAAAGVSPQPSDAGSAQVVVDELEAQLRAAHARIRELERASMPAATEGEGEGEGGAEGETKAPAGPAATTADAERARQLQERLAAVEKELQQQRKASAATQEKFNRSLNAEQEARAQLAEKQKELDAMWKKLGEVEARLKEEGERTRQLEAQRSEEVSVASPAASLYRAAQAPGNTFSTQDTRRNNRVVAGSTASFASPPGSPSPAHGITLGGGGRPPGESLALEPSSVSPKPGPSGQPIDQMTPLELKHEVMRLRQEVETHQSNELRLSMEIQTTREKLKEEKMRRRESRQIRAQMLSRLQTAVEDVMVRQNEAMSEVPDVLSRSRQASSVISGSRK